MGNSAKLSSKSQITIPSWVRRRLGIGPGSRVRLQIEGERLILENVEESIEHLEGALRGVYGEAGQYTEGLREEWKARQ